MAESQTKNLPVVFYILIYAKVADIGSVELGFHSIYFVQDFF